jgi:hypothetical protein
MQITLDVGVSKTGRRVDEDVLRAKRFPYGNVTVNGKPRLPDRRGIRRSCERRAVGGVCDGSRRLDKIAKKQRQSSAKWGMGNDLHGIWIIPRLRAALRPLRPHRCRFLGNLTALDHDQMRVQVTVADEGTLIKVNVTLIAKLPRGRADTMRCLVERADERRHDRDCTGESVEAFCHRRQDGGAAAGLR